MNISKNRRRLAGQLFEDLDETGGDLRHAIAMGSRWVNCTFRSSTFAMGDFGNATFDRCIFIECDLSQAILIARFIDCRFEHCDLDSANLTAAELRGCTFAGGRAQFSTWERATVVNCALSMDLHSARLDFAEGKGVNWSGANLWNALIPLGCAFFAGSEIDEREADMFLSLLLETKGGFDHAWVEAGVTPRRRRAVARLVASQT